MNNVRRSWAIPQITGASSVLLLLAAPVDLSAREPSLHSPNGGGCSDSVIESSRGMPATTPVPAKRSPTRDSPGEAPMVGGANQDDIARPRWHSILPGMLR